jgi:hypothetical protein
MSCWETWRMMWKRNWRECLNRLSKGGNIHEEFYLHDYGIYLRIINDGL